MRAGVAAMPPFSRSMVRVDQITPFHIKLRNGVPTAQQSNVVKQPRLAVV